MSQQRAKKAGTVGNGGKKQPGHNITRGRKSLHLLRKIFHALAGVALASVYEVGILGVSSPCSSAWTTA